jgi:RimJ/RimL family protein N-acetyltransferase
MKNKDSVTFIEGNFINLCPLNLNHVNIYIKWMNDYRVRLYARNILPRTVEEWKKFFENQGTGQKNAIDFEIFHKKDEKPIGEIGLFDISWLYSRAIVGLSIGETEYWNKGICTEAIKLISDYTFQELNLNKLYSHVFEPNINSYKCLEKNGFVREAILKQDCYIDGKFVNTYIYLF